MLHGTPGNDDVGEYLVVISVMDPFDAMDVHNFTLTVLNVNDPPVITSGPPEGTAIVRKRYSYRVSVTDPDTGDVFNFSLDVAPPGMTIDPSSGQISWVPTADQRGPHEVVFHASDGNASAILRFEVVVEYPPDNIPPIIRSDPPSGKVKVGERFAYLVEATDQDASGNLEFELLSGPPSMEIDPETGVIDWTPEQTDVGEYTVRIRVNDGLGGEAEQTFELKVSKPKDDKDGRIPGPTALVAMLSILGVATSMAMIYRSKGPLQNRRR